jgi:shikimate dehydrogenase
MLCGLIGAGIQGSLSPALHEEEARHHGLRLHYQLIDLETAGRGVEVLATLIEAARVMRFAGLNVTYPCKQLVIPLLDELSGRPASSARSTPSCAVVIGWSGTTPMARAGAGGSGAPCRRPTSRASS